jgi:DNA mismatch endonuclease, patch repair protein
MKRVAMTKAQSMAKVRQRDTLPEMRLRRALWRQGFRYRLHDRRLPGTPDIVFRGRRLAVFVHGCFWHGHDCHKGRAPKTNREFWREKLDRNRERDRDAVEALQAMGWRVVTVWECEAITVATARVADRLSDNRS